MGGIRKRKPHVYWHSKTHKTVLNAHIEKVTKAQTDIYCSKMASVVLRLVSAHGKWSWSGLCWRSCFGHAWWWAFSEICSSRRPSRCRMRLSAIFVCWKSGSQSSHYHWLRVISCTFKCRVLLCSTKHWLVRGDVIATTDIHVHFFGVTFTVTV